MGDHDKGTGDHDKGTGDLNKRYSIKTHWKHTCFGNFENGFN